MKILIIATPGEGSGWTRYTDDLSTSLRKAGEEVSIEYLVKPLRFKKHLLLSPIFALKLFLKYRREGIGIVHCVVEPFAFPAFLIAKLLRVPYVITFHGTYSVLTLTHSWLKKFQTLAYRKANALVAVSHYTKDRVLACLPDLNIAVVPNGIRAEAASAPRNLKVEKDLIGVGALKYRKGYHLVIEALGQIKEELKPFHYYIVGDQKDTPYVERLRVLAKEHGVENEVVFTGHLRDEELRALYEKADLFILTPISEGSYFEGFGLVYLEANARGIPVVGMKGSGAKEAIKDGYNGLLAETKSVDDIALKVKSICEDGNFYEELSKNAVEWAKLMNWDKVGMKYIQVYNENIN